MKRVVAFSETPYVETTEVEASEMSMPEGEVCVSATQVGVVAELFEAPLEVEVVVEDVRPVVETSWPIEDHEHIELCVTRSFLSLCFIFVIVLVYWVGRGR